MGENRGLLDNIPTVERCPRPHPQAVMKKKIIPNRMYYLNSIILRIKQKTNLSRQNFVFFIRCLICQ
jgi:hypothetical protein